MAYTFAQLITPQYAPATLTAMFTLAGGQIARIDKLTVCNSSTLAASITTHIVPSGGTADASNILTNGQTLTAGQTWVSPNEPNHVLAFNDAIWVQASLASTLVIVCSGVSQT